MFKEIFWIRMYFEVNFTFFVVFIQKWNSILEVVERKRILRRQNFER